MFICTECCEKKCPNFGNCIMVCLPISYGPCEVCGKTHPCHDCHTSVSLRKSKKEAPHDA